MDVDAKRVINKQRVADRFTTLITIEHLSLAEPIRVCSDLVPKDENGIRKVTSRGYDYICYSFDANFPDQDENQLHGVELTIANVDRMIIDTIKSVVGKPDVTIEQVLSTKPDVVQNGPFKWHLTKSDYDAQIVTGELGLPEDWRNEPYGRRFKRTNFRGMA